MVACIIAGGVCAQTFQTGVKEAERDVVAVVLRKNLTVKDKNKLSGLIFGLLRERFAEESGIDPTEEELDAFIVKTEEKQKQVQIKMEQDRGKLIKELKDSALSDRKRKQKQSR